MYVSVLIIEVILQNSIHCTHHLFNQKISIIAVPGPCSCAILSLKLIFRLGGVYSSIFNILHPKTFSLFLVSCSLVPSSMFLFASLLIHHYRNLAFEGETFLNKESTGVFDKSQKIKLRFT